jgi:hypothetical protein
VRFFYAPYEEAKLWGEDLTEAFEAAFLHGSRFVVMFSSAEYARKMWPTFERRAVVERAMSQNEAYILPVRFDDTRIPLGGQSKPHTFGHLKTAHRSVGTSKPHA